MDIYGAFFVPTPGTKQHSPGNLFRERMQQGPQWPDRQSKCCLESSIQMDDSGVPLFQETIMYRFGILVLIL